MASLFDTTLASRWIYNNLKNFQTFEVLPRYARTDKVVIATVENIIFNSDLFMFYS